MDDHEVMADPSSPSSELRLEKVERVLDESSHDDSEKTQYGSLRTSRPESGPAASGANTALRSSIDSPAQSSMARVCSNNGYGVEELGDEGNANLEEGQATTEKDPFEVAWDSDQDPLCPRSMPLIRKWILVVVVATGSLCVTCASSIYTSTYAQMNPEFGIYPIVGTLGLSTFVLGIALGPLLMSPLSEFFGRRPIYLVSWSLYVIWVIPSAVAQNIQTMLIARFFDGFAGSAFLSVSGGSIADVFTRDQIQAPMVIFSLAPFIGPSLGPLIGGFINSNTSWRWTYWFLLIWSFVLLVAIVFFAPETFHPIQLRVKARRLRRETGDDRWRAPIETSTKSISSALGYALLRPFQLLLTESMCMCLDLFSAVLLGIIYLFFGAFGLIFGEVYEFNLWQTGLAFLGIFTGMVLASASDPIWHGMRDRLIKRNDGKPEPEHRLPPAIGGAILVPIGLFIFAWTSFPWVHWIAPIIGSGIFGMGALLVFTGIFTFLVDAYPQYAASALAANAFVRCAFAAAFPLFGIQMYKKLGYQWGSSLLAFLTVAMMPFPYVFFVYGKRLRKGSRFATR